MRFTCVRALVLVALAAQLGACSSFLGIKFARSAPREAPVGLASKAEPPTAAAPATEAGRGQLAAGQNGLAIESFQRALASGEPIAPAVNGLGVAYARLGRYDLAQRFFEQAMATDPGDARYADNLARLMRSPMVINDKAALAAASIKAAESAAVREASVRAAEAAPPALGRLQRVSRGEVRIVTAPTQPAPTRSASAAANPKFRPLVRISFADVKGTTNQDFVRVQLPEPAPPLPQASQR